MSQIQTQMENPMFRDPYAASYEPSVAHEREAVIKYTNAQPKYDAINNDYDYLKRVFSLPTVASQSLTRSDSMAFTQDMYTSRTPLDGVKYFDEKPNSSFYSPLRSKFKPEYEQ